MTVGTDEDEFLLEWFLEIGNTAREASSYPLGSDCGKKTERKCDIIRFTKETRLDEKNAMLVS